MGRGHLVDAPEDLEESTWGGGNPERHIFLLLFIPEVSKGLKLPDRREGLTHRRAAAGVTQPKAFGRQK